MRRIGTNHSWRGELFLERGWVLYDGPVAPTSVHAHHAIQIILACAHPIEISDGQERRAVELAVIPPDRPHAFATGTPWATILYVAPESQIGRYLAARENGSRSVDTWASSGVDPREVVQARVTEWSAARAAVAEITRRLGALPTEARAWPTAVEAVVSALPERLDGTLRLSTLAREVGLSASRLSHLLTANLGIPFRVYVLWLRLARAAGELAQGRTLTEAAHAAGFADSAHLSRVFRRMFGIAPSDVTAVATWHVPDELSRVAP